MLGLFHITLGDFKLIPKINPQEAFCQVLKDLPGIVTCQFCIHRSNPRRFSNPDIDDCAERPCQFGRSCTDKVNDFYCDRAKT